MNIWIEIWMSMVGMMIPAAGIPQAVRLLKRGTSGDISLILYFAIVFCQLNWLWYGFYLSSICIIITNIACLSVSGMILFLCLYYRRKPSPKQVPTIGGSYSPPKNQIPTPPYMVKKENF